MLLMFLNYFNYIFCRFYSVISPGDTVNVIGEFNEKGICHVNRESNFVIVHPDILVSGTRVITSCLNIIFIFLFLHFHVCLGVFII